MSFESFSPRDKPVLILMDELMNFVSRSRKSGMAAQLYSFLHNLSEEARGRDNMVLAVSIPGVRTGNERGGFLRLRSLEKTARSRRQSSDDVGRVRNVRDHSPSPFRMG